MGEHGSKVLASLLVRGQIWSQIGDRTPNPLSSMPAWIHQATSEHAPIGLPERLREVEKPFVGTLFWVCKGLIGAGDDQVGDDRDDQVGPAVGKWGRQ